MSLSKIRLARHVRITPYHSIGCICPECRAPRPSDPQPAFFSTRLSRRAAAAFGTGMLAGAAIVALTGNLRAALRALVGL